MKAMVIGATGATGKDLVNMLLSDNDFELVSIFVRREMPISNSKLTTHKIDFNETESWKNLVNGDVLFSCLGTTLKAAGSKEAQWKIDYDYQYEFAKAAKENGVSNYVLVSSASASPKSPFFYSKMKGQLEEDIKKLEFEKTIILNPPLLERENTNRKGEIIGLKLLKTLNKFGILKSQQPLATPTLAKAMINTLKNLKKGFHQINLQEILNYTSYGN